MSKNAAVRNLSREDVLSLVQSCRDLAEGRRLQSLQPSVDRDTLLSNRLIQMYGKCGSPNESRQTFDRLAHRNIFSWVLTTAAFANNSRTCEARAMLDKMPQRNEVAWHTLLSAYAQQGQVSEAVELLQQMPELNTPSCTVVMAACVSAGELEQALKIFHSMPRRDIVSWNALITAFARRGDLRRALGLFHTVDVQLDSATLFNVVGICTSLGDATEAMKVKKRVDEARMLEWLGAWVINMLAKCGEVDEAAAAFRQLKYPNAGSWNSLLASYAQAGRTEDARRVFDRMQPEQRTVVSWNTMVSMYSSAGNGREAMSVFTAMDLDASCKPNAITFTAALDACTGVGALARGRVLRDEMHHLWADSELGLEIDATAAVALVKMLARCGSVDEARAAFDDVCCGGGTAAAWNTMIGAYAHNARPQEARELFTAMAWSGAAATAATFTSLLATCSHEGSLAEGREIFQAMEADFGVDAVLEHFVRMIDLLGRSGRLADAEELIAAMPFEPDAACWTALLGACKLHKRLDLGVRAATAALSLDSRSAPSYVLLSNVYAEACLNSDVAKVRRAMHCKGIVKTPGRSWIEVKGRTHEFLAGDVAHPRSSEIYARMKVMEAAMVGRGYAKDASVVLHDVEEAEKKRMVGCHSEKLAVAFGLLATPPGEEIKVFKNLRICLDCHAALKLVAQIERRSIVVRDANRFHRFEQGRCSCGDYW